MEPGSVEAVAPTKPYTTVKGQYENSYLFIHQLIKNLHIPVQTEFFTISSEVKT